MLLYVPPAQYIFHTRIARYSLYMLKVPLDTKQANKQTSDRQSQLVRTVSPEPPRQVNLCSTL